MMSWIQRALFAILKALVKGCLRIYYPFVTIKGKEHLQLSAPTLIVSNHPNTLMDPLNVVARVSDPAFFLANAGLFTNPIIGSIFRFLYCIPVERPQDTNGRPLNNEESFSLSYQHLAQGGHLYIAPEGSSYLERHLRPLRTGTARIGLGAMEKYGATTNIRILPVGLNYDQPRAAGSRLWVNVGEPILLAPWFDRYHTGPRQAVIDLTAELEDRLGQLIINTLDDTEDQHLMRWESVMRNEYPLHPTEEIARSQELLQHLRHWQAADPDTAKVWLIQLEAYHSQLNKHAMTDSVMAGSPQPTTASWWLLGVLGPVYGFAWLNNWLPLNIPRWLVTRLNLYVGYDATVKLVGGLVTFPLFYSLQTWLLSLILPQPWPLLYALSLPLGAIGAWWFRRAWRAAMEIRTYQRLSQDVRIALQNQRQALLDGWSQRPSSV
ncbi:MAG: 1-acyl-sn-glycerol-3-phosphate acyltransferase [Lewinellaceae bacterium]|nr:1-acyl-sn-glycerol-3-phosphate acyltransferase [Lewinellaceae bacterium]